ncbi:hypothetical protein HMPREF1862_00191 [Varibaculum cambriense]|uniref:Uncharacterized protein n=1 Tax=Varibaculum cambriense TaxID=184870 RepID=A0AB34X0Y6_9ACTO|nr:hypothetical protein HMPREF1862_00191 [Varibaculum cambriense]
MLPLRNHRQELHMPARPEKYGSLWHGKNVLGHRRDIYER